MSITLPKTCSIGGGNTGLVATIGVTLLNPDGTTHTARATADIYEIGGGCYGKEITFEDNWNGVIMWDSGGGSPVYASEEYNADTDRLLLLDTTIATLASQTCFTLTTGSADDDAYNNCTIVIEDASTATQKAIGLISNYVGGSKTVTLKYDPGIFTMAVTDKIYILAENALKSMVANRQLDVASDGSIRPTVFDIADQIWDELQSGHTDVGSFGYYLDQRVSEIAAAIGSGLLSCTWTQKDGQGNPMDNVQIWITTDESGANVVAGALYTNTAGEATFMLDAGTYYVWREKGGYNFTNPQTWTVS